MRWSTTPLQPANYYVWVGLDSVRADLPAPNPDDDWPWEGWNWADMSGDVEPDLSAVSETHRLLVQHLTMLNAANTEADRGDELSRRLACAVSRELNTLDWSAIMPVTDDFVVFAVDVHQEDFDRNMPKCVPPDRLAGLRERGLL